MKLGGAQLVCRALKDAGVRWVFGIPGTHNIELYDAMIETSKLRPILVTDEQCASFMADGVARVSGGLAAVNVVPGAGLTHALSGIAEAFLDQVPLLVLACGLRQDTGSAFQLHDVDQAAIARPVCKKVYQPSTHNELYKTIREACDLARIAPAGPVMVEVPANLYLFPSDISDGALDYNTGSQDRPSPSPEQLNPIIETLNKAENIALYVGNGVADAREPLIELADRLDAIVFTTISAKGLFPENHPRWAWNTMGAAAPPLIRELEEKCDCWLAIGCRFGEVATASYGFSPPEALIHVDIDAEVFQKNYQARHTLTADARQVLHALLSTPELKTKTTNQDRLSQLSQAHATIRKEQKKSNAHDKTRVSPFELVERLQKQFGPDAAFVTDSGNGTFLAMELLRLSRPRSFMAPIDYSCMGYSVPAAIGAKLAAPKRPVVALAGDGAFLMTGLELLSAATYKAGVVVCLLNDGKLSQIAQFQQASLNRETCTSLPSLDYRALSQALQIDYLEITNNEGIGETLAQAQKISQEEKPVLINILIDYSQPTYFSKGVVKTNFLRFPWRDRLRLIGRVLKRKIL